LDYYTILTTAFEYIKKENSIFIPEVFNVKVN